MSKNLRKIRNSQGQIVAKNWGDIQGYCSLDLIPESKAVRQGSAFLSELGITTCTVKIFYFLLFFAGAIWSYYKMEAIYIVTYRCPCFGC